MPTFKQISCSIELGPSNTKLKEYDKRYKDGIVEMFVAVPEIEVPFHIRIQSHGYIAPGLAAFVYMDGDYQMNRNRRDLPLPGPGVTPTDYQIDFCMRQKEEKTTKGLFVGRDWTFSSLDKGQLPLSLEKLATN